MTQGDLFYFFLGGGGVAATHTLLFCVPDCVIHPESTIEVVNNDLTTVRVGCCAHWEDGEQWETRGLAVSGSEEPGSSVYLQSGRRRREQNRHVAN